MTHERSARPVSAPRNTHSNLSRPVPTSRQDVARITSQGVKGTTHPPHLHPNIVRSRRVCAGTRSALRSRSLDPADARRHAMPRHQRCHAIKGYARPLGAGLRVAFTQVSHRPEAPSHVAPPPCEGPFSSTTSAAVSHEGWPTDGGAIGLPRTDLSCEFLSWPTTFAMLPGQSCVVASFGDLIAISSPSHRHLIASCTPGCIPQRHHDPRQAGVSSSGSFVKREFRRRAA